VELKMKKMKKVEIIIESIYLNRLLNLFMENGVTGYTIIRDIEGYGGHGLKTADEANDLLSNNYIFTVCEDYKIEKMIEKIRSFIDRYGGKCIISDTQVLISSKEKK
jgi:nitrogen regulatory protein PII